MLVALHSFGSYTELTDSKVLDNVFKMLIGISQNRLILRLYKKYIAREDVSDTISELGKKCWDFKGKQKEILNKMISACEFGAKKSELCLQKFGEYEPLRLVILDEPYCTLSDNIPLEDYDNNEGEPFWMRPQYIIENYSQMYKREKEKNNK